MVVRRHFHWFIGLRNLLVLVLPAKCCKRWRLGGTVQRQCCRVVRRCPLTMCLCRLSTSVVPIGGTQAWVYAGSGDWARTFGYRGIPVRCLLGRGESVLGCRRRRTSPTLCPPLPEQTEDQDCNNGYNRDPSSHRAADDHACVGVSAISVAARSGAVHTVACLLVFVANCRHGQVASLADLVRRSAHVALAASPEGGIVFRYVYAGIKCGSGIAARLPELGAHDIVRGCVERNGSKVTLIASANAAGVGLAASDEGRCDGGRSFACIPLCTFWACWVHIVERSVGHVGDSQVGRLAGR